MTTMDALAQANGFDSWNDMCTRVDAALIDTPARLAAFEKWKLTDGTKAGLLKLPRRGKTT